MVKKMIESYEKNLYTKISFTNSESGRGQQAAPFCFQTIMARSLRAGAYRLPRAEETKGQGGCRPCRHFAQNIGKNTLLHFWRI